MVAASSLPVTVKCRIGVDDQEPRKALFTMAETVRQAGAAALIVHARKAWLHGLSPKDNREIPPLDYALVSQLKRERPHLRIVLNGGLDSLEVAETYWEAVDGVMLGRAAYHTPSVLGLVDRRLFGEPSADVTPRDAVEAYRPYIAARLAEGTPLAAMTRHMLGLFSARPGARAWRRTLTVESARAGAGIDVVDRALQAVSKAPQPAIAH